jgi:hypothetical protein
MSEPTKIRNIHVEMPLEELDALREQIAALAKDNERLLTQLSITESQARRTIGLLLYLLPEQKARLSRFDQAAFDVTHKDSVIQSRINLNNGELLITLAAPKK